MPLPRLACLLILPLALAACAQGPDLAKLEADAPHFAAQSVPLYPNETPELRASINKWADHYELPRSLVHRLAIRESTHRPWARNGPYWGLLQILPATARSMGFQGSSQDLLDADTNLQYALKYLRGAYLVADEDPDDAIKWYARGYYYEAKKKGLLEETGLR
ncbi:transglycosylase SLT domain-containing protein [Allosediminivita pacifica]|uniref:Transglycosylase-like protein with SLT domain n=1 Tax=Allosediminivita pacifica TaxID=1267769 RepID=A0A2T6B9X3_9RHOB|nr:lytic transglycosylase domain-containing protein [Allosediminivita pacifica]PTX52832.1 transglycosylase-like protein with SLT domain [Allosediminivita pacifica]GGA95486.1 lytic transglycosylase [Allosediminivita pacifica]